MRKRCEGNMQCVVPFPDFGPAKRDFTCISVQYVSDQWVCCSTQVASYEERIVKAVKIEHRLIRQ